MPFILLLITRGGVLLFASVLALVSCLGIYEFYRMALPGRKNEAWLTALPGSLLVLAPYLSGERLPLACLSMLLLLSSLLFLARISAIADAAREAAYAILAVMYIPFLLMHLVMLRQTQFGPQWLIAFLLIVMGNDSAAYYIGSAFGKHRLYELVSPKKSIEGSLGGIAGGVCGIFLAKYTFFPQLTVMDALILAIAVGVTGQAGDLFESMLKRSFGVKDSGTLFPGHGGVLDRLDSILFAAPVATYYVIYFFKG